MGCNRTLFRCCQQARICMRGMTPWPRNQRHLATTKTSGFDEPSTWNFNLNIEFVKENERNSFHWFIWQMILNRLYLWNFKLFCDRQFNEREFLDNSKLALSLLTQYIIAGETREIRLCTTPMGFKQVMFDISSSRTDAYKMLCFEKRHILRAIPLQIKRLAHYEHTFAFIDVIFVANRRADDFESLRDAHNLRKLINKHAEAWKLYSQNPFVYAEMFVRFRRDYSLPTTVRTGQWLISAFKLRRLDVLNEYPQNLFQLPGEIQRIPPLSHGQVATH